MQQLYVIGDPIKHSRSPLIHNYWIKKHSLDAVYDKKHVTPEALNEFIDQLDPEKVRGINVTIPHKEAVFNRVKNREVQADALKASNCLYYKEGNWVADNTDGYGFYKNLTSQSNYQADNQKVIIYGAGGAARAILKILESEGCTNIYLYNRTKSRAEALIKEINVKATILDNHQAVEENLHDCRLLVNTTSLGMEGQADLNIDLRSMPKDAIISDIVYTPLQTNLLKQANDLGLTSVDGLGMLIHQAAKAFEHWFGILPEVDQSLVDLVVEDLGL